jgi:hypothetical protein
MADLAKVPDPRAVLEAALGPLARFEVLDPEPEPAPEPEPEPEPVFPGDRAWPEADPDLEPPSPKEWLETVLRGLPATF